ncbi:GntR family transcriptional regulator [Gilliamella sp. B2838]|uniref:GntR family transcriptional regulator n=1 Tax=Gilliamella sp. B2838 TaxID=2818020 RepID=UPI002269FA9C|nr:GntR family transcriptional regulator [Gilliamella sp. B2838]MCX8727584.1 GntR family transcriptional regulator [Gilliamella sp. B2838]
MEYRDIAVKTAVEEQIKANPAIIKDKFTERGLAEYFGVSRTTVRKALNDLAMEGYVFFDKKNTQYPTIFEINMLKMSSFSEEIDKENPKQIKIKVLSNQIIKIPSELTKFFNFNHQLLKIIRKRVLGEMPLSYEICYLPFEKFRGLETQNLSNVSLYQYLKDHYQLIPSHGREEITYETATKECAKYLGIKEQTPIYKVSSYNYDNNFEPFEHTEQYLIGNRFKYHLSAKNIFNYSETDK